MRHQLKDHLSSALILGFLVLQALAFGYLLSGWIGALFVLIVAGLLGSSSRAPIKLVLRVVGARRLHRGQLQPLQRLTARLARRAGLSTAPTLALIPTELPNAMALGSQQGPVIAITQGLLHQLSARELAGVLAHEISHIAHDDLGRMAFAQAFAHFSSVGGQLGGVLLILAFLSGQPQLALAALVLMPGPLVAQLALLALSRRRELAADHRAVQLTGDPVALATALQVIDAQASTLGRLVGIPGGLQPPLLRTHPATEARVARLRAMAA
ncbi:MAG TPA: hypothetical protein ENK18_18830 [Deltaproteobacteria bacterium]|nr:hypothetical protein [Deltaproteobacteria bacterium]